MKKTKIHKVSLKQAEREAQRREVVAELKAELGDVCEVCEYVGMEKNYEPYWIPIVGHEIIPRSKGIKSCKMDRTNIILLGGVHHDLAQARKLPPEYLQEIVDKRNGIQKDS